VDIGDASVQLCNRVCESLKYVDNDQAMRMIRAVLTSERIFIAGTGRSGLIGRFLPTGWSIYLWTLTLSVRP